MSYTNGLDKPDDYFNTVLYTGNGSTQSITGVGFQPDWVWIKDRTDGTSSHRLIDSVRGATKEIYSNLTNAENTDTNGLTSFNSDGFSVGTTNGYNKNTDTFVSWNWLAGGTASSNTDGSITSSVSANTDAGFSIVSYTGNATAGATVGHGLGSVPKMIITKGRSFADDWLCYNENLGNGKYIILNKTNASASSTLPWNSTTPTSSVFTLGSSGTTNNNGGTIIAYCFAEKKGYSKFGSYTGNGNADGTFIYTGFKPAWFMVKRTNTSGNPWIINDNKRDPFNFCRKNLFADASTAETDVASENGTWDLLSNGVKMRNSGTSLNGSGSTYIYMAFAENPFVTSTGIPTTAR